LDALLKRKASKSGFSGIFGSMVAAHFSIAEKR